jgi:DnaA N-terminal domain
MNNRKHPKPDVLTTVITEVEEDHYRIKNWVAREWIPIIGVHAYTLYGIYCSAANKERGNSWFFSLRTLEEFTFLSNPTINMNNWLLELCGLIRINSGEDGYANEYVLLPPPHVTPEILKPIIDGLKAELNVGKNWQVFKANTLERIMKWKPLHECGKVSQFKKGMIEAKTEPEPAPVVNNNQPQNELVARLMAEFKDSNLSEAGAIKMITDYGEEAVKQQLAWLPQRKTNLPLRTLRAALKENWMAPKAVSKSEADMQAAPVETGHALSPQHALPLRPAPNPMWQEVKERLEMQLTKATYDNWIRPTELVSMEGNEWVIQCASSFAQDWLANRLNGTLTKMVASVTGREIELKFVAQT